MRHLTALAAAFAALALLPGVAMASPGAVVRDCAEDGSVDGHYSNKDKRAALREIPADLDEYSDCRAVISASIGGKKGSGKGGSGGAGGPAGRARSAAERKKLAKQARERKKKREATQLALGERKVDPRNSGLFNVADTTNGLPTPVLVALIALALLCAAGGVAMLRKRNLSPAEALRRVRLPRLRR